MERGKRSDLWAEFEGMVKAILFPLSSLLFLLCSLATRAQVVVVLDEDTQLPVVRASLYTKEGGRFRSAITNEQGVATVPFDYSRLTVSHLNYEKRVVRGRQDTIRLRPRYQTAPEVTVTNREPEWIRRKLRQAVRNKQHLYFSREATQPFVYDTQTLSTDHLYQYHLTGLMLMKSASRQRYAFVQDSSLIVASDSTRLTDTTNLRRMLYEDFVDELDNAFIRDHRFSENPQHQGLPSHAVELRFFTRNRDDHGLLVLDTTRCVVLSAYRYSGTKTNRSQRVNKFFYTFAKFMGYRIDTWTRDYRVIYAERPDGTFYPSEVRYKFYMVTHDSEDDKQAQAFTQQTGGGFPNMEAVLRMAPPVDTPADTVPTQMLPPSWYITYNTDADRQREVQLANLKATFRILNYEL